jgi:putative endonuclease
LSERKSLGAWGESRAAEYLIQKGYRIEAMNLRTPYGEIDLLAEHQGVLVFVEVKTRSSTRFGLPEEAVNRQKQQHMLACAQSYLQSRGDYGGDWRIDVIAISRSATGVPPEIIHFENVEVEPR